MKYARIKGESLITARVIHDATGTHDANAETPSIPAGWSLVADEVSADESDLDGFPELTRRQIRLALLALGVTATMVDAVISQIPDAGQREAAMIYWQDTDKYSRKHPLVVQIAAALSISESQLDTSWNQTILLDAD